MSSSQKSPSRQRSGSKGKPEKHKLFVTNLDVTANEEELKSDLEQLFSKYGTIGEISVKRAKKGDYKFAFVEYKLGEDGEEAVRSLNGSLIKGKPMKVELQDDNKRRKDPDIGCYTCGKKGHFARECRSNRNGQGYRRNRSRSRSISSSQERHKKRRRRRSDSQSSEERRSRHKKDRKHSSKDKAEKKKKKHKKNRNRSRSSSDSRS